MNRRTFTTGLVALVSGLGGLRLRAQEAVAALPNVKFPTLGGKQCWADLHFFHEWRIQRDALTGHHRLLNPTDKREAWGTFDACQAKLSEIRREQALPDMHGKAVVILHGLGRSRSAMTAIARMLQTKGGFQVFNVGYPTLLGSVGDHAKTLDCVIKSLEGIDEIHFVCHSLGNLVVRRWLFDTTDEATGKPREHRRLGRMVMLGPPNHRPELAEKVGRLDLAMAIGGKAFRELAEGWEVLAPTLMTPPLEFGILAGGRGDEGGYNPLVPGDDDMIVSVQSTRLAGACDFRVLPVVHTFMMNDATVQQHVLQFLNRGYFESKPLRQPIEEDKSGETRARGFTFE
jgi:pimeloyl-ACP methyl ester carboxylesterase